MSRWMVVIWLHSGAPKKGGLENLLDSPPPLPYGLDRSRPPSSGASPPNGNHNGAGCIHVRHKRENWETSWTRRRHCHMDSIAAVHEVQEPPSQRKPQWSRGE